jgi:hypothetical protein
MLIVEYKEHTIYDLNFWFLKSAGQSEFPMTVETTGGIKVSSSF